LSDVNVAAVSSIISCAHAMLGSLKDGFKYKRKPATTKKTMNVIFLGDRNVFLLWRLGGVVGAS
jgi:SNF family Na+-dependent transporter